MVLKPIYHLTIQFTIHTPKNIPNVLFIFLFTQKRDLNPCYFLNALQSLAITAQREIEENCTENIRPAYAVEGFKTQKCSCCQKEKLTISSDDVLFSNLML